MKLRRKHIIFLVCIVVILVSIGAYYYNAIHRLRFQLVDVGLGTVGLTSVEIKVKIEIQNPNALPVYIPSLDFDIYVNNNHLGYGYSGGFTVGGSSSYVGTVSLTFPYLDIATTIVDLILNHAKVTVRADGSASFFIISVPFSTTLVDVSF